MAKAVGIHPEDAHHHGRGQWICLEPVRSLASGRTPRIRVTPGVDQPVEDAVLPALNDWIDGLVTPEALAEGQGPSGQSSRATTVKAQIAELDKKIGALVAAIEAGVSVEQMSAQLDRPAKERADLEARLRDVATVERLTAGEMQKALDDLGGIATILPSADPAQLRKLYTSRGVRLEYNHLLKRVQATAESACVLGRVRRGT